MVYTEHLNSTEWSLRNKCFKRCDHGELVSIYLSHQVQEAWGGQETGRGRAALPSLVTGLGND